MNPIDVVFSVVTIVLAVGALGSSFSPRGVDRAAHRLARRVGLALEPTVERAVRARARRRLRFAPGGALIAVVIMDALLLAELPALAGPSSWAMLLGAVLLGAGAGSALGAMTLRVEPTSGMRVARARPVGLADYVPATERIGARVLIGVAVLVQFVLAIASLMRSSEPPRPTWVVVVVLMALGVLSLLAFEVLGRRLIARPQPAGSTIELAWDDALRAVAVRDLATTPIVIGLYGTALGLGALIGLLVNVFSTQGTIALGLYLALLVAGAVAIPIITSATRPQRHFLRRLWPEVAAR